MSLKRLPATTVKLIGSSQVITSVSAAVKELIENSIDAGAKSIDVKLENHGLERIEVRDDGSGVSKIDVAYMCQKSYTSKIQNFQDLEGLESYGFRGEALNALCAVGQVTVTTKTGDEEFATTYRMDSNGCIIDSKPSHINKGTVIVVEGLFKNLPVRRQFLSNGRRKGEEIKKVESEIKSLAIIHPGLRVTFSHNKFLIWQKNKVSSLMQSLSQAIPSTVVRQLHLIEFNDELTNVTMDIILPKKDCNVPVTCYSTLQEAAFIFINLRRVKHKVLEKVIQNELFQYFGHYIPNNKHPFSLVSIKVPPNSVDVNLEPNKNKVLLNDQDYIVDRIKKECIQYYCGIKYHGGPPEEKLDFKLPKRKIEDNSEIESEAVKVLKTEDGGKKAVTPSVIPESVPLEDQQNLDTSDFPKLTKEELSFEVPCSTQLEPSDIDIIDSILKNQTADSEAGQISDPEQVSCVPDVSDFTNESPCSSEPMGLPCSVENTPNPCDDTSTLKVTCASHVDESETTKGICEETPSSSREEVISNYLSGLFDDSAANLSQNEITSPADATSSKTDLSIDEITPSQWSMGKVLDSNHEKIKGSIQLMPGKLISEDTKQENKCSENSVSSDFESTRITNTDDLFFQQTLENKESEERSVTSQMGCKQMSAFTKFADEMRAKILEKKPGTSFASVAGELVKGWRKLEEEEKEKYEAIAKKENEKKKSDSKSEGLQQTTLPVKVKKVFKKPKKYFDKIKEGDTSVSLIKEGILKRCMQQESPIQNKLIGKICDDLFCYINDNEIRAVSYSRLKEVISFYKNLSTMEVPVKVLEKNLEVLPESLDDENWKLLLSLKTDIDLKGNAIIVDDEVIKKNGLRIEVKNGESGPSYEITDVPANISCFGVPELNEILTLMKKNQPNYHVLDCRPLKVVSFIRSETIRMLTLSKPKFEDKDFASCFQFWLSEVKSKFSDCPHYKPVASSLGKI